MPQEDSQSDLPASSHDDIMSGYLHRLEMHNSCLQNALSHASHYISEVQGMLSSATSESQELKDLYAAWCTALQRCQIQCGDCLSQTSLSSENIPSSCLDRIEDAPLGEKCSASSHVPRILRDCLIIQTDGVSEALENQAMHIYTAELRLLREKVILLQEEFSKEHDLRIASEKLNTCLQDEIRSQAKSIKEYNDENTILHDKIKKLKAQMYEMETSAETAYDDNMKLAERLRQLTGSMSEIRTRVNIVLRLFGRQPAPTKPIRPVSASAATGKRRTVSYDINADGLLEDCKQLQLLVAPLLKTASSQDSAQETPSTTLNTSPVTHNEPSIPDKQLLSQERIENPQTDVFSYPELPSLMYNSVIQQPVVASTTVSPTLTNKSIVTVETTPLSMQVIIQRLRDFESLKEQLSILTVETESTRVLLQRATHDKEVAEKKSSEYQDKLARAEAEIKRINKTLRSLMEAIVNFDSFSDPPIFDTSACAQGSLDTVEPVAKSITESLAAHNKNSFTTIKLMQQKLDAFKLEIGKLRMSNIMLLKREACNTSVIRNMEQQIRRLSDENFFLAGENSFLLGKQNSINPDIGLITLNDDNKALREQLVSMQQKYCQLKSENDKLMSSHKALKIEFDEEQSRRTRAEERCVIMRDEIQEANDDRRSRSASRPGSRRSSVSGPSSFSAFRDDPQVVSDTIRSLKRTIATVRLENVSLSSQIETLIFNEARTKQCATQLMLENHKLVTEAVCRDTLISSLQNEARRHLQTLLRMCVSIPSDRTQEDLRKQIAELEDQLLARDKDLKIMHEERVNMAAQDAALCIDTEGLSAENIRLTVENNNLTKQLEIVKQVKRKSFDNYIMQTTTNDIATPTANDVSVNTPKSESDVSNSRLLFTLARADIVLSQKHHSSDSYVEAELSKVSDSVDKLALQNKHLQDENTQMKNRLKEAERQHVIPHDSLLRMARYLNEKEEEIFVIVEMAQNHNSQLISLHNYASRLMNEYLPPAGDNSCSLLEASDIKSLQIRQILRQFIKEVTSLKPLNISCKTASIRVSTTSELLQRFTLA